MFGSKRRILRKAIEGEMKLMDTLRKYCKERDIPPDDCDQVESRWKDIAELLNKIIPPEPLTKRELIIRAGVVIFGFLFLAFGVGLYVKVVYFPHDSVTYTSIEGEALEYRYVPEERVVVSEFPDVAAFSTSDNLDVARTQDVGGNVVELIARETTLELYDVRLADDGRRALVQTTFAHDFHATKYFREKTVVTAYDFQDASIVAIPSGYVLAGAVLVEGTPRLLLASFDAEWQMVAEAVSPAWSDSRETGDGLMLVATDSGYKLLTTILQDEGASVLERTVPYLREFDANLQPVRERKLDSKQLTLDTDMGLYPLPNGGFYVFSNGKNPITGGGMNRGDDLYLLSYNDQWELMRIVQLTINGLPHDFHPSRVWGYRDDIVLMAFQQIQGLPQVEGEGTGYAAGAGKVFVMALKGIEKVVGTIFAADYNVRPNDGEPLVGGANAHIALWGDRLFVAHDYLVEEDEIDLGEGGDGAYRIIRAGWWKLSN